MAFLKSEQKFFVSQNLIMRMRYFLYFNYHAVQLSSTSYLYFPNRALYEKVI